MDALWSLPDYDAHEGVHFFEDAASGLRAIIVVHSTHLGPAAGGARFRHYGAEGDALNDALRLSRGMSYKNAMAGLPMGGGKAVILAPATGIKTPAILHALGRAIDSLGGQYITAVDVGMSDADMVTIGERTAFVSGLPVDAGEAGGDPGPFTSHGVYLGVRAAAARALGARDMKGVRVAIQGVGSVGGGLARLLAADGAQMILADRDTDKAARLAEELGATVGDPDAIHAADVDLFSPNAMGAILNERSIGEIGAKVVAGGANNQLATPDDACRVAERGILYAPDYVINAGGIINVARAYVAPVTRDEVMADIARIPARLNDIWDESDRTGSPPSAVADAMARKLIGRA